MRKNILEYFIGDKKLQLEFQRPLHYQIADSCTLYHCLFFTMVLNSEWLTEKEIVGVFVALFSPVWRLSLHEQPGLLFSRLSSSSSDLYGFSGWRLSRSVKLISPESIAPLAFMCLLLFVSLFRLVVDFMFFPPY